MLFLHTIKNIDKQHYNRIFSDKSASYTLFLSFRDLSLFFILKIRSFQKEINKIQIKFRQKTSL